MKCKCRVELFDCDVVKLGMREFGMLISDDSEVEVLNNNWHIPKHTIIITKTYRCPKCHKTKKVKIK